MFGFTMETMTILKWLKKKGGYVEQGYQHIEVEHDITTTAVEANHPGYLKKIIEKDEENEPAALTPITPSERVGRFSQVLFALLFQPCMCDSVFFSLRSPMRFEQAPWNHALATE